MNPGKNSSLYKIVTQKRQCLDSNRSPLEPIAEVLNTELRRPRPKSFMRKYSGLLFDVICWNENCLTTRENQAGSESQN